MDKYFVMEIHDASDGRLIGIATATPDQLGVYHSLQDAAGSIQTEQVYDCSELVWLLCGLNKDEIDRVYLSPQSKKTA